MALQTIPCTQGKVPADGMALFGKWPKKDVFVTNQTNSVYMLERSSCMRLLTVPGGVIEKNIARVNTMSTFVL